MERERAFWLAWSQINGVGPILLTRLQTAFGCLEDAWNADPTALTQVEGIGWQTATAIATHRQTLEPTELLRQHSQENSHFWTPADSDYPKLLLEIPDPPAVLYYRGEVDHNENQGLQPMVAIVGTRDPSDYGKRWAQQITRTLAQHGFTIVSGLAEGVDTETHRCCVDMKKRTIAVVGTGVERVYPWQNRNLYKQILHQGLVVSEYPHGTKPDRTHFPRRNRIIAGLCRAVIVIEAPEKSGALITARVANDYGRDVYVLPGSLDNPRAIGCLNLLNHGAQVILGEAHLLEMLGSIPQLHPHPPTCIPPDLEPDLQTVLQILADLGQDDAGSGVDMDRVVQTSGLSTGTVSSALLQLELLGLVTQQPGMRYQPR